MKSERWQQVDRLFQAALALDPQDRASFLDHACEGDEALRREVESLIASHDESGSSSPALEANTSLITTDTAHSILQQQIGPYRIVSHIGAGGMGEVYLAQDTRLGRKVALKLLPDYFTRDEQRVRRFQQEARAASALNHPNIITIHEIGETEGRHFIATEYVEGETLRQRLARDKMSTKEVLDVGLQVASGLSAAHHAGILHRDIKPENIMLRSDGYVKVLDFGLAKLVERSVRSNVTDFTEATTITNLTTEPGIVMGTPEYMSPAQARGERVDNRSDIFSFGVVMYEMLTGRVPFKRRSLAETMNAVINEPHRPVEELYKEVPPQLSVLIDRALAKEPADRYQSVDEMMRDLRQIMAASAGLDHPFAAFPFRHARALFGAVVLLLLVAALLSFWIPRGPAKEAEPRSMDVSEIDYKGLMVLIPAGEFTMGSDNYDDDEKPAHSVSLSAYYIDKFEVTNKQYREFCEATGRTYPANPPFDPNYFVSKPDFPVMGVLFQEAVQYANFVGKRLPTEEEWEKAASWSPDTQSKHIWPWGDTPAPGRANLDTERPAAVGHYVNDRSAYGVHDMGGNVTEWVDGYYESYDPKRSLGAERVKGFLVRGGIFLGGLDDARTTFRNHLPKSFPPGMSAPIGFRCAVSENDPKLREFLNSHGDR